MSDSNANHVSVTVEQSTAIPVTAQAHENVEASATVQATPLGTTLTTDCIQITYLLCICFTLDGPPPAYEAAPSSNASANNPGNVDEAVGVMEAPPPYCLVDPSKIPNMDHIPHYSQITPVEIIDLNMNSSADNEQVIGRYSVDFSWNFVYFFLV